MQTQGVHFAVLYLDLDRFKSVNDRFGHAAGDGVLAGFARLLERCLRPGDIVARAGGDKFTILLPNVITVTDALSIAERIHAALLKPFALADKQVKMTAGIGIAVASSPYRTANHVLRDADSAMYQAKGRWGGRHAVFPMRRIPALATPP